MRCPLKIQRPLISKTTLTLLPWYEFLVTMKRGASIIDQQETQTQDAGASPWICGLHPTRPVNRHGRTKEIWPALLIYFTLLLPWLDILIKSCWEALLELQSDNPTHSCGFFVAPCMTEMSSVQATSIDNMQLILFTVASVNYMGLSLNVHYISLNWYRCSHSLFIRCTGWNGSEKLHDALKHGFLFLPACWDIIPYRPWLKLTAYLIQYKGHICIMRGYQKL